MKTKFEVDIIYVIIFLIISAIIYGTFKSCEFWYDTYQENVVLKQKVDILWTKYKTPPPETNVWATNLFWRQFDEIFITNTIK